MRELTRNSGTITVANLWENIQLKKFNLEPAYQRLSVWSEEKQSFFIDSIFKNYPIPPIFLKQNIDSISGRTTYDVVDGKQRIISITRYIGNEIPVTTENDAEGPPSIYGLFFDELNSVDWVQTKKKFWSYLIPVEYIDADDFVLNDVFDRLNRNGEPLTGQELRKAKYFDTPLQTSVERFSLLDFWKERLQVTNRSRMEDHEFIAELIFMQIAGEPLHSNQTTIDGYYSKYAESLEVNRVTKMFEHSTRFLVDLDLPYEELRVTGTSHLYGLWCLATYCNEKGIYPEKIRERLIRFFEGLKASRRGEMSELARSYKTTMSARTKDKSTRLKRFETLLKVVQV